MPNCVHCSNPLEVSQEASGFCCTGCEFVYQLIHDEGLENFYDLKREDTLAPLSDKPFQKHDFSWLQPASNNDGLCRWDGSLQGISCIGCVWLVEKLYMRHDGAVRCDVAPADGAIHLEWQEDVLDPVEFAEELQKFGYLLGKQRSISSGGEEVRQLARKTAVCGAFAMNAMVFSLPRYLGMPDDFMFAGIFEMIAMISATLAMLVGGAWFIRRSFHSLRAGVLHMDTPIALGVSTAYAGSVFGWSLGYFDLVYFDFVAVFIFLMLGGRWIQTVAVARNRNRLLDQTPVPRAVKNSPERAEVPLDALSIGDHYVSDTGQTLPVASKVVDGAGDFSLEWINGEPEPCHFSTGMHVPAGAILLSRSELVLEASQAWQDSLLAQLTAEGKTSDRSLLLEKILRVYLAAVITLGIGGALFWWSTGSGAERALQVMISVFVISCPCALGVALPMADELASSAMQRLGVFVRQSGFWSKVRRVRTLFFDKTGTLTGEVPELIEPDLLSTLSRPQVAALATMCAGSPHPLSRSLMRALGTAGQRAIEPEAEPEEIPGLGMLYQHGGHTWSLGKCGWQGTKDETATAQSDGCELRKDGSLIAEFRFSESLRPDAKEIIQSLANYKPHILSGDHQQKVSEIADQLELSSSHIHAQLSPDEKANLVQEIDADGAMFLGDGANDSLAFDSALVTGAVAGRGLLEAKADFYYLANGLGFLPRVFAMAILHGRAIRAVFTFSLIYNFCAIALCLCGLMNPLIAAILMPLSSLVSLGIVQRHLRQNKRSIEAVAIP